MGEMRVDTLLEALPYIKKFRGETFVIKYGGSIVNHEESKAAFFEDITLMRLVGINVVVVHGGGPDIKTVLGKMNIQSKFIDGLRVTDRETMDVVEMVLSGSVNKHITSELCCHGLKAIGVSGRDNGLLKCKKKTYIDEGNEIELGFVGDITGVNDEFLTKLISTGFVPVISPIACDGKGTSFNINADSAASAVSGALNAKKLILLTDVPGVMMDLKDEDSLISKIALDDLPKLKTSGVIKEGMIPKIQCCMDALQMGTEQVHLIDGRKPHSLLLEIFTDDGIGTMIEK